MRPSAHNGAPWGGPETAHDGASGACAPAVGRGVIAPSSAHVLVRRSRRIVQAAGFDVFVRTDAWTRHGVGVGEDSLRIKYGIGE